MGTLIGLMGMSRSALEAEQKAIDVTANNVANQNTAGYTRQVVRFTTSDAVALNGFQGNGSWVTATVTSQRDRVLEHRLQNAVSSAAASDSRLAALTNMQAAFGLTAVTGNPSSTTLGTAMDKFFASLQSLTADPTDETARTAVLSAAGILTSAFHQASGSINQEIADLNGQIGSSADTINGLTSTIAQLNEQIKALSPESDAGTLEDQRQRAIQQLSGLVGVNQVTTDHNGVTLTLSNGALLVSGQQAFTVSSTNVNGLAQLVAGDPPTVQQGIQGGSIGGMMQARDQDFPPMLNALDTLANGLATAVNAQNQAGITSSGTPGVPIFSLPATVSGSAANITVAISSSQDVTTAGPGEGINGTSNAALLAALTNQPVASGETASVYFGNLIGQIGNVVQTATNDQSAQNASKTQAQTQRDAFSAVNLDDEASQLAQYQRSYEAAAKVFSIVNQMLAVSLNLGTEQTYS